jgi:hypothetical protein
MKKSAWVLAASLLLAGAAAAQVQPAPAGDAKAAPATPSGTEPAQAPRLTGSGRDQFIAPVMGIQIQGEGLALPQGVAEDDKEEPAKPAAAPAETKEPAPRSTQ